jgi:hypothetical protein
MVAMEKLRLKEPLFNAVGIKGTAEDVMGEIGSLHSVLLMREGGRKAALRLGKPKKTQVKFLSAFVHLVGC